MEHSFIFCSFCKKKNDTFYWSFRHYCRICSSTHNYSKIHSLGVSVDFCYKYYQVINLYPFSNLTKFSSIFKLFHVQMATFWNWFLCTWDSIKHRNTCQTSRWQSDFVINWLMNSHGCTLRVCWHNKVSVLFHFFFSRRFEIVLDADSNVLKMSCNHMRLQEISETL